jgi:hypothetical protein
MDKQNVVYINNGILFGHKKEGNSDTCYMWMNPKDILLSEKSQTQTQKATYCIIPFI